MKNHCRVSDAKIIGMWMFCCLVIITAMLCSCGWSNGNELSEADIPENNEVIDATDALNLLFDSLFDDAEQESMQYIDFIDTGVFLGYEYLISIDANPKHIKYWGMSSDNNYHIFWLNEQVSHDGEFSHATTGDFFAVHIDTGAIISERANASYQEEWNDKFPW